MEDAVKRCAEMGRPLMVALAAIVTTASTSAGGASYGMNKLSLVSFLSRVAAQNEVRMEVTTQSADAVPFLEDVINVACRSVGKPEEVTRQRVHYWGFSESQQNWRRYSFEWNPAASVIVISGGSDAGFPQASREIPGNFIVGGCSDTVQAGWYVPLTDYFLFPDDVMNMGAIVNKEPDQLNSLLVTDILRIGFLMFLLVGILLNAAGIDVVKIMSA